MDVVSPARVELATLALGKPCTIHCATKTTLPSGKLLDVADHFPRAHEEAFQGDGVKLVEGFGGGDHRLEVRPSLGEHRARVSDLLIEGRVYLDSLFLVLGHVGLQATEDPGGSPKFGRGAQHVCELFRGLLGRGGELDDSREVLNDFGDRLRIGHVMGTLLGRSHQLHRINFPKNGGNLPTVAEEGGLDPQSPYEDPSGFKSAPSPARFFLQDIRLVAPSLRLEPSVLAGSG